jgi:hypothetical protein
MKRTAIKKFRARLQDLHGFVAILLVRSIAFCLKNISKTGSQFMA